MKVTIQDKTFEVVEKEGAYYVNGTKIDASLVRNGDEHNMKIDGANYRISIEERDGNFKIRSNGKSTMASVSSKADEILSKIGISDWSKKEEGDLKAPMPGKILDVLVSANDSVEKGQGLIILEAMKMENMLKSPKDGVIAEIKIQKENTVEKNQILITFEN